MWGTKMLNYHKDIWSLGQKKKETDSLMIGGHHKDQMKMQYVVLSFIEELAVHFAFLQLKCLACCFLQAAFDLMVLTFPGICVGIRLLSFTGYHAPRCQTSQYHD